MFVGNPGDDPEDETAVTVVYEAAYASGEPGTAESIRYAEPRGNMVELVGQSLPWQSPPLAFDAEGELLLVVKAPPEPGVALTCTARTDQGPYGREAAFATPDPVCRVKTTLEALEGD